ncbi:non-structural protein NSP1 [Human rotavirus A]|uniref:Non-structural protein 1 n=2 Tax=Rotavirus A TaxID=28875 RepID=A0A169Q8M8_9REOV|nr:NSP1 [Rotavirus G8]BAU88565.1 non-structural protein NSP1 [Human rotavirus A]
MATFKDACYHYKRMNKLNGSILKLGANDEWRPAPITKFKGWCLDCCQYTNLTYCRGCALYHVCQWCSQYNRCFLDEEPHLLRMRTFKNDINKEDVENLLNMYDTLFPIHEKIVNKFINNVKQRKCRNEYLLEWYNHLLFPLTLQALAIKLENSTYYIFGYYDCMEQENQTPFHFVNLINNYDRLLLDDRNFSRMAHLPPILQQEYALRYFSKSRFMNKPKRELERNDFADNLMEDRHSPTSLMQVTRIHNCKWCQITSCYKIWEDFRIKKIYNNVLDFIRALSKSNGMAGHCSSQEEIYKYVSKLFLIYDKEQWTGSIDRLFKCLEPVDINEVEYVLFDHEINWEVRGLISQCMNGNIPRILNLSDIRLILSSLIYDWFDIRYMRETPMTTSTTNELRKLNRKNELIDEYDLELSDVE